jgi:formate dehydrogenase major subunit
MQPGVVYTTFHYPGSGANVVTTDNTDWATNCPEYKVTAVEVRRSNTLSAWQERNTEEDVSMRKILEAAPDAAE